MATESPPTIPADVGRRAMEALPKPRISRAADASEPDTKIAQREGYDEGWNDCLSAVRAAITELQQALGEKKHG